MEPNSEIASDKIRCIASLVSAVEISFKFKPIMFQYYHITSMISCDIIIDMTDT